MKTHNLLNTDTGESVRWNINQILYEVNRDRSEEWTDYDEYDWEEGLSMTDYALVEDGDARG